MFELNLDFNTQLKTFDGEQQNKLLKDALRCDGGEKLDKTSTHIIYIQS